MDHTAARRSRPHVMVVEDDPMDRDFIANAFQAATSDIDLVFAGDGDEALEKLRAGPRPAIVITDLNMPRLSGQDLLERMWEDETLRAVPTIVLSTADAPHEIRACYARSANAYVVKPDCPERYQELARRIVDFWICEAATLH